MISKRAIGDFLDRELDDFLWIKNENEKDLIAAIAELPAQHTFHTKPYKHQAASFYIGACLNSFLYFLDMGAGKTFISLNLIKYYKNMDEIKKTLVVVPNVLNIAGWKEEISIHAPNLKHVGIYEGNIESRFNSLKEEGDVYVINYDGLQTLMTSFVEVPGKTASGKKKKKRKIDEKLVKSFVQRFQMVIFDEIHFIKNSDTMRYKLCKKIAKNCSYRYGLTGTPFGRDPHDLWAEFNVIDNGETLGTTLGIFRGAFFNTKSNGFGIVHEFKKEMKRKLNKTIQHRSLRYEDKEFEDLPSKVETDVPLMMAPDALMYYEQLKKESYEKDDEEVRTNFYAKWRQICSGFVYENIEDDELGKTKFAMEFSKTEKLDAVEILIEDMPTDSKMVIFHVFNKSGEMIVERLKKLKIPFAAVNSTVKDKVADYNRFKNNPKCKILVVNIGSGNAGLNLQNANYVINYEPTDRPIWYKQAMKRVYRTGQKKRCYFYHFHVKRSVEDKVLNFIKEGKSLFDALIEGKIALREL